MQVASTNMGSVKARKTDIVDIMLKIMNEDDGPPPKKNYRNISKRRNAVDQFKADHHTDYANGEKNGVNSVHQHNNAVPKLIEALDKRKSVTTVTTIKAKAMRRDFNPNCTACARIATLNELKKLNLRPRCKVEHATNRNRSYVKKTREIRPRRRRSRERRSPNYNRRPRDKNSNDKRDKLHGVNKPRARTIRKRATSLCKLSRIWSHKSCQCSRSTMNDTKESKLVCCPSARNVNSAKTSTHEVEQIDPEAVRTNKTFRRSNDSQSKFPHSRTPSLSSYNSFMSMDHEPMDST